ncbi:MAG TPA: ABC transporter permease [Acidimicrobiia bacterium]|nr:ABC transporter permease [Acidimicrobiia bacterium]
MASITAPADRSAPAPQLADVSSRPNPVRRLIDLWQYRELLGSLVRKELKVKYKNSVLGFVWSLLNPALYLVVFYVVFTYFLPAGVPNFAIFLLAGLLPWNLFGIALGASTGSITGNASLVTKVWFPREILPLASIGAGLVHFLLQTVVLLLALVVFRQVPAWSYLPLLPVALFALVVFLAAMSIALAAINVYARDTEHLLELALLAWFWMTPIVYAYRKVADHKGVGALFLLNPLTPVVITFQRALYNKATVVTFDSAGTRYVTKILPNTGLVWYAEVLGILLAVSLVLLFVALVIFGRLEDNFAEEI